MHVTRFEEAKAYQAPKHYDMRSLRLQGLEATAVQFAWVGLSHFLPGGGAEFDVGVTEKIYVVIEGQITIALQNGTTVQLGKLDSCCIPAGEARAIRNETNAVASMIVIMPPPGPAP